MYLSFKHCLKPHLTPFLPFLTSIQAPFNPFKFVGNKAKGRTCAYQGVRNIRFPENLACFVFLKHVLRFALLPYYWQIPLIFLKPLFHQIRSIMDHLYGETHKKLYSRVLYLCSFYVLYVSFFYMYHLYVSTFHTRSFIKTCEVIK